MASFFLFKIQKMQQEIRLKLAIQKSGRLTDKSLELLKESGIYIQGSKRRLTAKAKDFPLDIVFLRDDDIPGYIEDGIADIGIIGENVFTSSSVSQHQELLMETSLPK